MLSEYKRPFWLHQLAEYIVGAALVATGVQSPDPLVPVLGGVLIVLNTAVVDAPLGAFRRVGRRVHRVLDVVVLLLLLAGTLLASLDGSTRVVMALVSLVFAVVVWRTNYTPPEKKAPVETSGGRADELGRLAGRTAGSLAGKARKKWRERS